MIDCIILSMIWRHTLYVYCHTKYVRRHTLMNTKIFPVHCLCSSPLSPIHRAESTMLDHSTGRLQGFTLTYAQLPEGPSSPMTQERQTACGKRLEGATFSTPFSGIQVTNCLSSYLLISFIYCQVSQKINYTCFLPFLFHIALKSTGVKH